MRRRAEPHGLARRARGPVDAVPALRPAQGDRRLRRARDDLGQQPLDERVGGAGAEADVHRAAGDVRVLQRQRQEAPSTVAASGRTPSAPETSCAPSVTTTTSSVPPSRPKAAASAATVP